MVSYKEFEALKLLLSGGTAAFVPKAFGHAVFHGAAEWERTLASLEEKGYVVNGRVTEAALVEMEPCRVANAVILAAGGAEVSAKSVYSMPKGLYTVNGEVLIERQIRQLHEAGIKEIIVIVGYKQELYFYLQEKFGVKLEVNPDLKKNNINSLYVASRYLGNTYICNCDNYFKENPFSAYEYDSFHATVVKENARNELLVATNTSGRITGVYSGDSAGECVYGHAYMDRAFAERFKKFLAKEIDGFRTAPLFWEEFVDRHIEDLDMYVRRYTEDFLYEFDSIQEIQHIDGLFLETVSGTINEKICDVLHCRESDIGNIEILQKGLSNVLFTFVVHGEKYIFRYPGDSTAFFIYRRNEVRAQQLAAKAGVDGTYLYIDEEGVKISRYRENCVKLEGIYYRDVDFMKRLAKQIRKFHEGGFGMPDATHFDYNPIEECERLMREASKVKGNLFEIFEKEWAEARLLKQYADKDGIPHTMCHNDINADNVLLTEDALDIIDWEFAGFNDPGYDFGRVIIDYDFDSPVIDEILEAYFGRPATEKERLHWIAYAGIHNWYYVGWALYKESINESSRDWMLFFYRQSKRAFAYALPRYKEIYGGLGMQQQGRMGIKNSE